jgi:hypothetical protein
VTEPTTPAATPTTADSGSTEQNTGAGQENNGNTPNIPAGGNQVTDLAPSETPPTGIWASIGNWWNSFINWMAHIFG